jgi:hypothetical protein
MFVGIATFLAAGLAQAGTDTGQSAAQPARTSVQTQAAAASRAQADGIFYAGKAAKTCTYRGGPKTGSWDCR